MRFTVVGGRAHTKHTEGGDFRQATYRAIRQGLMEAQCRLLEPYYEFRLQIPPENVGRAMTDLEHRQATFSSPEIYESYAVILGEVPVSTMRDYQIEVNAYTKGRGSLFCTLKGYGPCHNEEEVLEHYSYNPDEDVENPSSSVFCSHGSGMIVPWYQVKEYMHVEGVLSTKRVQDDVERSSLEIRKASLFDGSIDEEQIEAIMNRTYHANEKENKHRYKKQIRSSAPVYKGAPKPKYKDHYLIVDGYNIVHAWDELKCLVNDNLEGARMKLLDVLSNYQAFVKKEVIVVFDAYKVKGNIGEMFDYHNIHVVYTKEAETADAYIEKLTHQISKEYHVTVATSDGLIQLITRGQNCIVMSARELKEEVEKTNKEIQSYLDSLEQSNEPLFYQDFKV